MWKTDFSLHLVLICKLTGGGGVRCHFSASQRAAVDMHDVLFLSYIVFAIVSIL